MREPAKSFFYINCIKYCHCHLCHDVTRGTGWRSVLHYPDFSKLSFGTIIAALGQLFYSMSLAMGIMFTYGSYLNKKENLEASVRHIELFDTGIAFYPVL